MPSSIIKPRPLELLAPARNINIARQAILHGADAVYIGASLFGARSKAGNSTDEIKALVEFAAPYEAKVYVTFNTIILENELKKAEQLIKELYYAGVDALIVQDMSILRMDIPPIALHASTQCDTRSLSKAEFLESAGFSQIVLARESSLVQIKEICDNIKVPIEVFVHGALCVCYSGDCRASYALNGRSANRGECCQVCRLPFDLVDGSGKIIEKQLHLMSLKDLNLLKHLDALVDVGVSSFKIEGRLKDEAYVKNVTAAYSLKLDEIISRYPEKYCRSSRGKIDLNFNPDVMKSFNRGYTSYFFNSVSSDKIAQFISPKSIGLPVGSVVRSGKNFIIASLNGKLNNGDGLSYISPSGKFGGFRLNRVEKNRLFPQNKEELSPGTQLFRNYDKKWEDQISKPSATRKIELDVSIRVLRGKQIVLGASIDGVGETIVSCFAELERAKQSGLSARRKILEKFGDTPFILRKLTDEADEWFIPASKLTELRRQLIDKLIITLKAVKPIILRRPQNPDLKLDGSLTMHDNVANSEAKLFYESLGAKVKEYAAETSGKMKVGQEVMNTKYCLRKELGACLKNKNAKKIASPLILRNGKNEFDIVFDCNKCEMKLYIKK